MSNHRKRRDIDLHHNQVNAGRARKTERAENRRYLFELNRTGIKFKVEADRQYLALAALVFLMGLTLITFGLVYVVGIILYG